MRKLKYLAVLQAATDETVIPLELEAIEWALKERYRPSAAFNHSVRRHGLGGRIGVGCWLKSGGENSRYALSFDPKDWNEMTLDQQNKVYQLIERVITGAQHLNQSASAVVFQ